MKETHVDTNLLDNIWHEYLQESLHRKYSIIKINGRSIFPIIEFKFILHIRQNDRFHRNSIDSIAFKRLALFTAP